MKSQTFLFHHNLLKKSPNQVAFLWLGEENSIRKKFLKNDKSEKKIKLALRFILYYIIIK
ncbi:hypothetical protein B7727_07765 [Streptococcus oralis subsp. tigurinus]|uniref:Uncharacterized protein n=1 Tax=Streptococcus oralis subsp. tigurinus TaxID=1077464 RepID=A0A1X1G494_STROR|nr:hypothetical protein B7727_07765 [Streptococcus oralis subsp. tigurinus]